MATKASRPVRTLAVFIVVIAVMYVAVAALGNWKPKEGLDLQGGTRITLQANTIGGGAVPSDQLNEAVGIISNRVNGAGVSESTVSTQGSNIIIVEIPGKSEQGLERTIGSTAQLRFRLVKRELPAAAQTNVPPTSPTGPVTSPISPTPTTSTPSNGTPSSGTPSQSTPTGGTPSNGSASSGTPSPGASTAGAASPKKRVAANWLERAGRKPRKAAATNASPKPAPATLTPTAAPTPGTGSNSTPAPTPQTGPPTALVPPNLETISDPLQWVQTQDPTWDAKLAAFHCPKPGQKAQAQFDITSQPLLACDASGNRYLLSPAIIEGQQVTNAQAELPQQGVNYVVNLSFDSAATQTFTDLTTKINQASGPQKINPVTGQAQQFAIVLDGQVISAPVVNDIINNGTSTISGGTPPFTQQSATSLANSLKYGALPLSFSIQNTSVEGPQLASSQLNAGIVAGIVGLILVVMYCLLYYRGLGFVVIASLGIAGLLVYASVLLLGHAYGFTLTLPGIAGLIVAVGITADSFIVYFERLRDEVRDGKTLRTSVETGWNRAKHTILAADGVSFLAALVLFIFAIGVVKGFAFALGLTTFMDVFVVFFFTKPMLTLLARTKFFGQGHKLSGLDRQHLGMPPLKRKPRTVVGGQA